MFMLLHYTNYLFFINKLMLQSQYEQHTFTDEDTNAHRD